MKLVVLFLVAVCCCCSLDCAESKEKSKLIEVLWELQQVRRQNDTMLMMTMTMLNSPPQDVEDCCNLPALQCFHANLMVHLNGTRGVLRKLTRSLKHTLTKRGVEFCPSGNNTTTTCHDCDSQPKVEPKVFFDRLQSLIQKANTRLGPN